MYAVRYKEMKIYLQDAGHMTIRLPCPYMVKTQNIFPGTSGPISTKLGKKHQRLEHIMFYSNDNPGLILTYFTANNYMEGSGNATIK